MADPVVAVVVLCHNYARFLPAAIESALRQTYPSVDVTVVDDGSTDDSLEVARRYEPDVQVVAQENAGVVRACNRAVAELGREWFTFLSADDRFEPAYVEELMAALARTPEASFAYSDSRLFGARSGIHPSRPFSAFSLVRGRNFVNGSALTLRQAYLDAGGYSEALADVGFEDWDFWLAMVAAGHRGTYVGKPLLHWRRHAEGSRNPLSREQIEHATARVRSRHAELIRRTAGARATSAYAVDRAVGAANRVRRLPAAAVRRVEESSWRRFSARGGARGRGARPSG